MLVVTRAFFYSHVVVEELLQFLVAEVDAELFKPVVLQMSFFLLQYSKVDA